MFLRLILPLLFLSCQDNCIRIAPNTENSNYSVNPNIWTNKGIPIDTSNQNIDLSKIDFLINELEKCMPVEGSPCDQCVKIKISNQYTDSFSGMGQVLLLQAPEQGCLNKGLIPTKEHPCRWRVAIQKDGAEIIVPPDMKMLNDGLIKSLWGIRDPWLDETIAKCAILSFNF